MPAKGYIYSVETFGTLDGPGIRFIVFMQGCPLRCKYCHNRDTWDMSGGREISVEGLLEEVSGYRDFYKNSGGGVTASGGEPTMQAAFVEEFFSGAKVMGLNTALDTSGYTEVEKIQGLLEQTDLVILDLKNMIPEAHRELTGVDNSKILAFARHLASVNKPLWIRQVLVPGLNTGEEQLIKLADFLLELPNAQRVELLGYHKLGTHKWKLAGCTDPLENTPAATNQEVEQARGFLRSKGVQHIK